LILYKKSDIVKLNGDDIMKRLMSYMLLIALCFVSMTVYANETIEYIDAESLVNSTLNIDFNIDDSISVSLFSGEDTRAERYGRTVLASMDNSEVLLHAYDCFVAGVGSASSEFYVNSDNGALSPQELSVVTEVYVADYPETFWFNGSLSYSVSNGEVIRALPVYTLNGQTVDKTTIMTEKAKFDSAVDSIIQEMYQSVPEGESDYETQYGYALWLHDKVADIVEYEFGPNHQSAYGVLVDKKAVCAGYSKAYQCLLNKVGIKAWSVKGQSVNPVTGAAENHEWNLLWLDGNCVYVDITWDDQQQDIYHLYFARSLQEFSLDHVPFSGIYSNALPNGNDDKCQHSGYFEHTHSDNIILGEVTGEKIKSLFTQLGTSGIWDAVVYDPTGVNVGNWLSDQNNRWGMVPDSFTGSYCGFIFNNMGNTVQGVEYHISVIDLDTTRLYLEDSSDKTECNFRMVSGIDDMEKEYNLCVAFYDYNGALMSLSIQQPPSYYQHMHINVPDGCDSYKVMLMEGGTIKPLCESISIE